MVAVPLQMAGTSGISDSWGGIPRILYCHTSAASAPRGRGLTRHGPEVSRSNRLAGRRRTDDRRHACLRSNFHTFYDTTPGSHCLMLVSLFLTVVTLSTTPVTVGGWVCRCCANFTGRIAAVVDLQQSLRAYLIVSHIVSSQSIIFRRPRRYE